MFESPRLDEELKALVRATFPEFCSRGVVGVLSLSFVRFWRDLHIDKINSVNKTVHIHIVVPFVVLFVVLCVVATMEVLESGGEEEEGGGASSNEDAPIIIASDEDLQGQDDEVSAVFSGEHLALDMYVKTVCVVITCHRYYLDFSRFSLK